MPFPIILGHEGVGVIERVGSAVPSQYQKGDHVILSYAACERCPHCLQGKPFYCYEHGSINFAGKHRHGAAVHTSANAAAEAINGSFFQQSSFASHALVTAQNVVKIPKSFDLAMCAPLGCGVQTGSGAVLNALKVTHGSSIAIFGCGAVGLSAVLAASKIAKAARVIAVDLSAPRLEMAKRFGAHHTFLLTGKESSADIAKQLKELASSPIGLDYALDSSGNKTALRAAFECLKSSGTSALVGGSAQVAEIDMAHLLHGRTVRGIIQGDSISQVFIPKLLQAWQDQLFPFHEMITYYKGGLTDLNRATKEAKDATTGVIKPVLLL